MGRRAASPLNVKTALVLRGSDNACAKRIDRAGDRA
jgi:hypothetical protein